MSHREKSFLRVLVFAIVITFLGNLDTIVRTPLDGVTAESQFVARIFDATAVLKTQSLLIGLKSICIFMIFPILTHSYISDYFKEEGIYLIVRISNRGKWVVEKIFDVAVMNAIYVGIYLLGSYVLLLCFAGDKGEIFKISTFAKIFVAVFVYMMIISMITLVVDVKYGSISSVIAGTFVACILIWIQLINADQIMKYFWIEVLNPAAFLFILHLPIGMKYMFATVFGFVFECIILIGILIRCLSQKEFR